MERSKLLKRLVATFLVFVLGGPTVGLAATLSYNKPAKATVSYADLNLENEQGVRVLYRRLQYASKAVCGGATLRNGGSIIMKSLRLQCYRQTLSSTIDNFDNEGLSRFHAG